MSDPAACRDCKFWDEQQALQQTQKGPTRVGICQRFPPQVVNVLTPQGPQLSALFPSTQALQVCGEFTPKPLIES
jgi:hypothetical protein